MRSSAIPQVRNRLAAGKIPGQSPTVEARCTGVVDGNGNLDRLNGKRVPREILVEPELVVRESTASCPAGAQRRLPDG